MAKIPEALRKKLLDQKKEMASGGLLISNKEWQKGRIRLLPCNDELPGHRVVSYYCKSLAGDKKGSTSPETFGLPCPIAEAFTKLKKEEKDVRDRAYEMVNKNVEYWVPVVVRGQEGTPDAPNIRIFPLKKTVYSKVNDFLTDEDVGEDITHPLEGRDLLIKKSGSGLDTEWSVDKLDPSPLHKDKAMRAALITAGKDMDVRDHFFSIDYDVLAAIYSALTGDEMPEKFRKAAKAAKSSAKLSRVADAEETDETEVEETEEGSDDSAEIEVGSRVSFTDADENTIEGEVESIEDGTASVKDDDGGEWDVEVDSLTLIAAEDSDGDEDEGEDDADSDDTEEDAEEAEEAAEDEPEIVKGSRVTFEGEDDATVTGKVVSLKGDTAKVKDDEGGEWSVDVSQLTLADEGEDETEEAEEEAPKASRKPAAKAPPAKAPAKPSAKKPAAEPEEEEAPPSRKTVARKPAAKAPPAKPAADKIRKAGKK